MKIDYKRIKQSYLFVFIAVCLLHFAIKPALSSEVDTFNQRFEKLEDSLAVMDEVLNKMFAEALVDANLKPGCNQKTLYRHLRRRFRNHFFDEFNLWLYETEEIDHIDTPIRQSIYRDFNFFQSPIQGGFARIVRDPTGKIIKVNGVRIGNDKFEHMMGSGYKYFKKHYLNDNPLEAALRIGWRSEVGMMGSIMTGVMSYADMVANFQGMRFWNHVLQEHDDVLQENLGPYVVCIDEQWQQTKTITLANYVDDAMDESINCSRFRTPKMVQDVLNRIAEYEKSDKYNRSYSCPVYPEKLQLMEDKYQQWLPWLINTDGHTSMKDLTKRPWQGSN